MSTFKGMLHHLGGVPVMAGIPFGPDSSYFFVDPDNGNDVNDGLTPATAVATLATAYAKTTADKHDVVFFIGTDSAVVPTATLTWANDFTHLIGLSGNLPGVGQRCRVEVQAANDATPVVTFSGKGCIIRNMQFTNLSDANVDSGSVVVSGQRNEFTNVMFAGMGHATPAARAGSYSLTVSGVENHFERCYIGLDTITRGGANADLVMSGSKNRFWDCTIASQSDTAGHFAVKVSGAGTNEWKDCLFHNMSVNWATSLTDAFNVTATSTHYIILRGQCQFVGYTGVADTVTHIYGAGAAPNAGMFLSTNPTT